MFPRLSWTHWAEDGRIESGLQGFVRFYMENTDGAQLPLDTQLPTYICLTTFWHYSKWAAILKNNSIAQIQAINFAQLLNQLKPNKWSQCNFLDFSCIFLFLPKPIQIKSWSLPSSPNKFLCKLVYMSAVQPIYCVKHCVQLNWPHHSPFCRVFRANEHLYCSYSSLFAMNRYVANVFKAHVKTSKENIWITFPWFLPLVQRANYPGWILNPMEGDSTKSMMEAMEPRWATTRCIREIACEHSFKREEECQGLLN